MSSGKDFDILVKYVSPNGETDGLPVKVAWNAVVNRFQEYLLGGWDFAREDKNPTHWNSRNRTAPCPKPRPWQSSVDYAVGAPGAFATS